MDALQRENQGRLGRIGLYFAVFALLGQVMGILVFLAGSPALEWLVFPMGFLAVPIGLVLYVIALIAVPLLGVVLGDAGEMLFGMLWLT